MSFFVLLGVISHNLRLRAPEVDIEKVLGADSGFIRGLIVSEYAWTALLAWVVGVLSALAITVVVTLGILDIPPRFDFGAIALSAVVVIGAVTVIAFVATARVLRLKGISLSHRG